MKQQIHRMSGTLTVCPGCGSQPKHVETLGKRLHHLECCPCCVRTPKMPTLQQAVEAWERFETIPLVQRGAA